MNGVHKFICFAAVLFGIAPASSAEDRWFHPVVPKPVWGCRWCMPKWDKKQKYFKETYYVCDNYDQDYIIKDAMKKKDYKDYVETYEKYGFELHYCKMNINGWEMAYRKCMEDNVEKDCEREKLKLFTHVNSGCLGETKLQRHYRQCVENERYRKFCDGPDVTIAGLRNKRKSGCQCRSGSMVCDGDGPCDGEHTSKQLLGGRWDKIYGEHCGNKCCYRTCGEYYEARYKNLIKECPENRRKETMAIVLDDKDSYYRAECELSISCV